MSTKEDSRKTWSLGKAQLEVNSVPAISYKAGSNLTPEEYIYAFIIRNRILSK